MPELSRFFGIVIRMFHDDHRPAHFHASYGGDEALFDVETLAIIAGSLPPRAAVRSDRQASPSFRAPASSRWR